MPLLSNPSNPTSQIFSNSEPFSCLADLLREKAKVAPESIALLAPDRPPITYSQLYSQIQRVAAALKEQGIGRNDRVAVTLPNGPDMAVAFLAIAATATCAPLNCAYRQEEFDFYLSDLEAKALITQPGVAEPARAVAQAKGLMILEAADILGSPPRPNSPETSKAEHPDPPLLQEAGDLQPSPFTLHPSADDIALVLHTSGTTSRPKIVPLSHRNLCTSADNIQRTLALQPDDRCLNVMPLFHIHGLVGCLLSSLTAGASVVCTPGFQADAFLSWLRQYQPTWYSAVPTIHQSVLVQVQQQGLPTVPLRFIRSSSAAMSARVMADIETSFGVPVIEAYGMTEASHQMTSNPLPPALRKPRSVGLSGQTKVAIAAVDQNQLLPQGEIGEVVVQGEAITQGYANNPEANAKAFFEGWFRTGDQGYVDTDGYLFLQGRLKEIVNRGGEKVSPLEVDEALMEIPAVHQAVAFAVPHPTLGEDLVAAVVLKAGAQITAEELRNTLFQHIADFKVPSQIIVVEAIPKGATGKLQRIGLADKLAASLKTTFVAPRNETEQTIATVMATVLQCDRVGVTDNFFVLGGDSIKGTQVAARLSTQFGVNLPNTALFRYPTVAELATEIMGLMTDDQVVKDLLTQLEGLSPEEVERLLEQGRDGDG